ncbi:hypothetical protein K491DRAFT_722972 [Lophiostoma macrostomum CBS 122681]|uniref:Zn(2)-C6 fungal-type domain-containing protein n=1 Tax=Lophiostoma macrostomum CBS 122681 TaxID=1314788 RepID=A0A6A6SMZ0_9PLEO|nr:hypothetical protein K491DRAFT_722972 [Lophiostoma macrostomum CBS 122681]
MSADTVASPSRVVAIGAQGKRNRVACEACHVRKVRCDVKVGYCTEPCTNCRLDNRSCVVRDTRPFRRLRRAAVQQPADPAASSAPDRATGTTGHVSSVELPTALDSLPSASSLPSPWSMLSPVESAGAFDRQDVPFVTSVPFACYPFVSAGELARLSPTDVKYLQLKGCLDLPPRPLLDEFVREYFMHVHPCTPILNEGEFWSAYEQGQAISSPCSAVSVSLLVVQAMLFAASAFVPSHVIASCGFSSFHAARRALHSRAQLLRDLRTEASPTVIAEASLLLSFHAGANNESHANTSQLAIAIHHARLDNAHAYSSYPGLTSRERSKKKRLWWACLFRDRIIALGLRRPLQITSDMCATLTPDRDLTDADFDDEMAASKVYDLATKRMLVRTFILQCMFAAAVTPTLLIMFPPDGIPLPKVLTISHLVNARKKVTECKARHAEWEESARVHSDAVSQSLNGQITRFFIDLTWLYHFSAQAALCHYEVLLLNGAQQLCIDSSPAFHEAKDALERAIAGLTAKVASMVDLKKASFLPISFIAYAALPVVLLSLNIRLSPSPSQRRMRQQQLAAYVEAIREHRLRFDYNEVISTIIQGVVHLSETSSGATSASMSWGELLTQEPMAYFRLVATLDYSLNRGTFSEKAPIVEVISSLSSPQLPPEHMEMERTFLGSPSATFALSAFGHELGLDGDGNSEEYRPQRSRVSSSPRDLLAACGVMIENDFLGFYQQS